MNFENTSSFTAHFTSYSVEFTDMKAFCKKYHVLEVHFTC